MVTINLTNIVSVMPPAMMIPIQKSHKIKSIMPAAVGGRGHVEYAFCVYILDCRRSKPRSYSSQSLNTPLSKNYKIKTRLSDTTKASLPVN